MGDEIGIPLVLEDYQTVSERTPVIATLKPGGKYVAWDLYKAGGGPLVIKRLLDAGLMDGGTRTMMGTTLAEEVADRLTRRELTEAAHSRAADRTLGRPLQSHADQARRHVARERDGLSPYLFSCVGGALVGVTTAARAVLPTVGRSQGEARPSA